MTDPASDIDLFLVAPALDARGSDPGEVAAAGPSAVPDDPLSLAAGDRFERGDVPILPWESWLAARLFPSEATDADGGVEVPAARLLYADDIGRPAPERVVVADPVSLAAGRDEATLLPPEALALDEAEAAGFVAAAEALFDEDGTALERGASGRWYLSGQDGAALGTPPAHHLAHREIGAHLPSARAAGGWRRLMTELQMLWHDHPLNAVREARGLPPLNGVWFWGGAALPTPPAVAPAVTLLGRDPLALALARHAGVRAIVPDDGAGGPDDSAFDAALAACGGGTLIVVELGPHAAWLANDVDALAAARERALARWVGPAARAVRDGRAASLTIETGGGREARYAPPRRSWLARLFGGRR